MNTLAPIFSGPRRRWLLLLVAMGLLQGALAAAAALWIGHAFGENAYATPLLLAGFVAGALLAAALKAREAVLAERLGQHYATGVRVQLFEHLTRADTAASGKLSAGVLMLRFVTDLNGLRLWASQGLARLWSASATLLAALGLLAVQAPQLALAAAAGVLLVAAVLLLASQRLQGRERSLRRARGRLAGSAHKRLAGLEALQQQGRGAAETERIRRKSAAVSEAAIARARLRGLLRGVAEAGAWLALVGVVLVGREGLASGAYSLPQVFAALTLAGLLAAPLAQIERAIEYRHGHRIAAEKLQRLLALPPAAAPFVPVSGTGGIALPSSASHFPLNSGISHA